MPTIQQNVSLQSFNTFGLSAEAAYYAEITSGEELLQLSDSKEWELPKFILGGGSNILLLNNFDGLVIHMNNKGIELIAENDEQVILKVQAGENWHQFVLYTLAQGYSGLENLSLIPGCVGASPMQNIGAYGVEIKDVFVELTAFHMHKKEFHNFTKEECEFGYRSSIFKTKEKGNYIISDVTFQLSKKEKINTSYGAIKATLKEKGINKPTSKDVSEAVIAIRQSKLPDPAEIGNSGSFFKNPVIDHSQFNILQNNYPDVPFYAVGENEIKVPAGWLIEQCGFKGKIVGNTGTYKNQALILVNRGNATGEEIWNFALQIQKTVDEKFGITLEPEVNLIGE